MLRVTRVATDKCDKKRRRQTADYPRTDEQTNGRTDERTNGRTSKEARHGALVHVRKRMRVTVVGYVTYGRPWTRTLFRGRKVAWEEKRAGGRERYGEAEVRGTEKERRWRAGRKS